MAERYLRRRDERMERAAQAGNEGVTRKSGCDSEA